MSILCRLDNQMKPVGHGVQFLRRKMLWSSLSNVLQHNSLGTPNFLRNDAPRTKMAEEAAIWEMEYFLTTISLWKFGQDCGKIGMLGILGSDYMEAIDWHKCQG